MTYEEFDDECEKEINGFHPLLANKLKMIAYDQGHSCGYDEVVGILRGLCHDFREINKLLMFGY